MKRITVGDVANAIKPFCPIITDDMVRNAIHNGYIEAYQNPLSKAGWFFLEPNSLKKYIESSFCPEESREILRALGLNFNQLKLVV